MITRSLPAVARYRYYRRLSIRILKPIKTSSRVSKDIVSGDAASLVEASVILAQDIIGIYVYSLLNQWTIIVYHFSRVKDAIVLFRACQCYYARILRCSLQGIIARSVHYITGVQMGITLWISLLLNIC
jgi:hypothetical protein